MNNSLFILVCAIAIAAFLSVGIYFLQVPGGEEQDSLARYKFSTVNTLLDDTLIKPIPLHVELDLEKVKLGERLFHDVRLSKDGGLSCASCHNLGTGATQPIPLAMGINGAVMMRNAPTVFNSGFNFVMNWDGKHITLDKQARGVILNPDEMGGDWHTIIQRLKQDTVYLKDFNDIYPEGINERSLVDALVEFEKSLFTPNSRFDQYLRGDDSALSKDEKEGYQLFTSIGCISCHQGINIGGNLYQKSGLFIESSVGNAVSSKDLGRFYVTGKDYDRYVFRVPSLRNIAITAPYFHNGSVETLDEAIHLMAKYQLGRDIEKQEVEKIASFLKTLTGTYKGKAL